MGCVLTRPQAERFLAYDQERARPGHTDRIFKHSTDRAFDYALAQTLSGLTDVFGVLPGFAYYDDRRAANAYATTARRMQNADGTVLLGRRFLQSLMQLPNGAVAVAAICAHEFSHIAQFKYRLIEPLLEGAHTVKRAELHADFLAGYYAGIRKRQKPDYPVATFAAALTGLRSTGTAAIQHGNSDERAAALARGFAVSYRDSRNFPEAAALGLRYVRQQSR